MVSHSRRVIKAVHNIPSLVPKHRSADALNYLREAVRMASTIDLQYDLSTRRVSEVAIIGFNIIENRVGR
jgi:hypothetical protein